jgi:hypothetical protein
VKRSVPMIRTWLDEVEAEFADADESLLGGGEETE